MRGEPVFRVLDDLLAIEGLGQKGLQDIKRSLSNLGLTLRSQ